MEPIRLLTVDDQEVTCRAVHRNLHIQARDRGCDWTKVVVPAELSALDPADFDCVWIYASNVIQTTGADAMMDFMARFRLAAKPVLAYVAWEPQGFSAEAIRALGVELVEVPASIEVVRAFFEPCLLA